MSDFPAFMALSSDLTGFSQFELYGTGVGKVYYDALVGTVGLAVVQSWLRVYGQVGQQAQAGTTPLEAGLARQIMAHAAYGPLARNLIRMWYTGNWVQLTDNYWALPPLRNNQTRVLTTQTYIEGLMWKAIGAHPMAAKQMGFGAWALPPSSSADY